ncbi:uncharacterized protein EAF02_001071 [Botrytis sinoallii]|uniref:uncharacterized protein n=1 Tax=Botrytis sinoallii TaxID=1463999 RepID=UPI001900D9B9|nr:uncharacterized protein EAF02_001071 [Botrytis sinoallii]KAF7893533.1 hypothetical protein EAF02_001071 [Botrytis sinoallii]
MINTSKLQPSTREWDAHLKIYSIVKKWGSLSERSRKDYIKAVQCLQSKPPRSTKEDVPGARSRYDDFSATHIKVTPYVHFSYISMKKPFVKNAATRDTSPTGIGHSPGKIRGNPAFSMAPQHLWEVMVLSKPNRTSTTISAFEITLDIPPATGGGCISGPFSKNYTVNLGPIAYAPYGPDHGLGYNPRCLSRDISLMGFTRVDILNGWFGSRCGMPVRETSFLVHHAMVDKVWSLWQSLNAGNRTNMVYGTGTAFNAPPSANITLDTLVDFGILAPKQKISSLISTIDGAFCYAYV